MKIARPFFILILSFYGFISSAQSGYTIRKINAFYIVKMPGNIPVDENGNSLYKGTDTLLTVYIELSGKGPEWKTAWFQNVSYSVSSSLISLTPYEAGTKTSDGKKMILKPAAGNKLWQLTLQKENNTNKLPQKIKSGEILLSGKCLNKIIYTKIDSVVQLTTTPSV
jgi:hypothetical protein